MATRTLAATTAAAMLLTACTPPSQPILDALTAQCTAGDQAACHAVPLAASAVQREKNEQSEKVAKGILLLLGAAILGAAAGAAAAHSGPPPAPVFVPPPPMPFHPPPPPVIFLH